MKINFNTNPKRNMKWVLIVKSAFATQRSRSFFQSRTLMQVTLSQEMVSEEDKQIL